MPTPTPGTRAPDLSVDTVAGKRWTLSERDPDRFSMIVFYRGLHCPVCREYIGELDEKVSEFEERGVEVIAISGDSLDRARQAQAEWSLENVEIGYGLTPDDMTRWDLYVSSGLLDDEPDTFSEPGLFLIDPDGVAYYAATSSMPFGRPPLSEMIEAVDFVAEKDFPARGIVEVAA